MMARRIHRWSGWTLLSMCLLALVACSSVEKPTPQPLGPNPQLLAIKRVWNLEVGEVSFPLRVTAVGAEAAMASSRGLVLVVDSRTGTETWRVKLDEALSAGVGYDGKQAAVVTQTNALVVMANGQTVWRYTLPATVTTSPLVAGNRVFVLTSDRTIFAFNAANGNVLWQQQRSGDSLVLNQPGLMMALGDTLVVGSGGRVVAMNPLTGSVRWELPVAVSRGTNEVEKLVELAAGAAREGQQFCVRAYQHSVACVDGAKPGVLWSKASAGYTGLTGDAESVFGVDGQGVVTAYRRSSGDALWTNTSLRYRSLSAPSVVGRSVVVGDAQGQVHLMAKTDGSTLTRLPTDGSAIAAVPVLAAQTLVVVTQRGGVFGFRPE